MKQTATEKFRKRVESAFDIYKNDMGQATNTYKVAVHRAWVLLNKSLEKREKQ